MSNHRLSEKTRRALKIAAQVFFGLCSFLMLQGCMTATITGVKMAYNHTHIQKKISDYYIVAKAKQNLHGDPQLVNSRVNVVVFQGLVLLTGQVVTEKLRHQVVEDVIDIGGIVHIYNFVTVGQPISMATRAKDTWVTAKVKSKIITSNSLVPDKIKVVTENGVVYLIAVLTHQEADAAVKIAVNTNGVCQVVKIFYYIIMPTLS